MSYFRFGFRRLEEDEEGDKEVNDRNPGSQELEEENLTAKETAKNRYEGNRRMIDQTFRGIQLAVIHCRGKDELCSL